MFSLHMDVLVRALSGTSAEMNGQTFCSRQSLSTAISALASSAICSLRCSNMSIHGQMRRSTCAILGFAWRQCRGAKAGN